MWHVMNERTSFCFSVNSVNYILRCGYVKCSTPYKGDGLRLTIYACCLWEMALNNGLDASLDNTYDWRGILEKWGEVNSRKSYITNDENSCPILNGYYIGICSIFVPQKYNYLRCWDQGAKESISTQVRGIWRELCNEKLLHILYSSLNIITMSKSQSMK
jgi:hypothetical protein